MATGNYLVANIFLSSFVSSCVEMHKLDRTNSSKFATNSSKYKIVIDCHANMLETQTILVLFVHYQYILCFFVDVACFFFW